MIPITVDLRNRRGDLLASAEAGDATSAILAARTLFDDETRARPYQGVCRSLRLSFLVDGVQIRETERRP